MTQKTGQPRYRRSSTSSSSSQREIPGQAPYKRVTRPVNVLKRCFSAPGSFPRTGSSVEGQDKEFSAKGGVPSSFTFNHGPLFRDHTCTDVLLSNSSSCSTEGYRKDAKVVVNVTVEGSPGPIRMMVRLGCSVEDTILAVVDRYGQEGRTPKLNRDSVTGYELHHSYFSLKSLEKSQCIGSVGSRSFYLRTSSNNNKNNSVSPRPNPPPPLFMVSTFIACKLGKLERRARKLWKVVICSRKHHSHRLHPKEPPLQCLPSRSQTSTMIIRSEGCGYGQRQRPCQKPRQRKLLVHVTVGRCVGAVRVVMSTEDTVADLVTATVEAYTKEMRRPLLREKDPRQYRLHYSSFCLESIGADENVMKLGSRNFFLCTNTTSSSSSSSINPNPTSFSIANFIDFLMFSSWP